MTKKDFDLAVVGAGPSGIMCAIAAARRGKSVILFDRNAKPGGKLPVTGNARCNLTNRSISEKNYTGENPMFVKNVFARFSRDELLEFFGNEGVKTVYEGDKCYPSTKKSSTVTDALERALGMCKIRFDSEANVNSCLKKNDLFFISSSSGQFSSSSLALCCGGMSYSKIFGSGGGYLIAESFSHETTPLIPGLTSFFSNDRIIKSLPGVACRAAATLLCSGKSVFENEGEVLFTHRGISGPLVLDASNRIGDCTENACELVLDFVRGRFDDSDSFERHVLSERKKMLKNSLSGILPSSLTEAVIFSAGGKPEMKASDAGKDFLKAFYWQLSRRRFKIKLNPDFNEAQVTVGGIKTSSVNPRTLESLIVKKLFVCGEMLDIAGDCGGYNLQFAFSSGYIAGNNA